MHVTQGLYATLIGDEVTVGHRAVVHGCRVRDGALIGIGAIVLDGAEIGEEALVAAGAVVGPGMKVPARALVRGVPARGRANPRCRRGAGAAREGTRIRRDVASLRAEERFVSRDVGDDGEEAARRPRRGEKRAIQRQRILDAARDVFFRDGFMDANLDEVAAGRRCREGHAVSLLREQGRALRRSALRERRRVRAQDARDDRSRVAAGRTGPATRTLLRRALDRPSRVLPDLLGARERAGDRRTAGGRRRAGDGALGAVSAAARRMPSSGA